VLEPPTSRSRPAPQALLLEAPPVTLYDAYGCVTMRNVHRRKMMYNEYGCLQVDEQFHFYFAEYVQIPSTR
jgi:hypothetical protein